MSNKYRSWVDSLDGLRKFRIALNNYYEFKVHSHQIRVRDKQYKEIKFMMLSDMPFNDKLKYFDDYIEESVKELNLAKSESDEYLRQLK